MTLDAKALRELADGLDNQNSTAEFIVERLNSLDTLIDAIKPFARYGADIRGQLVARDSVVVGLWDNKLLHSDFVRADDALLTMAPRRSE